MSHEGEDRSYRVKQFTVGLTLNLQPGFLKKHFSEEDIMQGFVQRFCHIILPPQPDGRIESNCSLEDADKMVKYEYLDETLNKLLDLRRAPVEDGVDPNLIRFSPEALSMQQDWFSKLTDACRYGVLKAYTERFGDQVLRMALGLHYLRLAVESIETGKQMDYLEDENPLLSGEDMRNAILISDIFMDRLDRFLWMYNKNEIEPVAHLDAEQQAFARHVIDNPQFYATPRTAREMIECGYETKKSPRELTWWLKNHGFEVEKKGRDNLFYVNGLKPWEGSAELKRLVFDESADAEAANDLYKVQEKIKSMDYAVAKDELASMLADCGETDDADQSVKQILDIKDKLLIVEKENTLLFKPESFDICARILSREGLLIPDGGVSQAAMAP